MGHRPSLPDVSMQPESTIHRVDHAVPSRSELFIREALRDRQPEWILGHRTTDRLLHLRSLPAEPV